MRILIFQSRKILNKRVTVLLVVNRNHTLDTVSDFREKKPSTFNINIDTVN